jgi:hypothetical protein
VRGHGQVAFILTSRRVIKRGWRRFLLINKRKQILPIVIHNKIGPFLELFECVVCEQRGELVHFNAFAFVVFVAEM